MTNAPVDFHCHLDLFRDPVAAIRGAEDASIYTLTVTTTPRAWPRNLELTRKTRFVRAALGLHPQVVTERATEITLWDEYLSQTRYVGEIGLDGGPRYNKSFELQRQVFTHILQKCDLAGGKILSVHSVRSATAVLDLIEAHLSSERCKVVLHWFTGSKSEAKRATELGCYFSINARMLDKPNGRDLVTSLPVDRLLTETDAPFTQFNKRSSTPTDVTETVRMLGSLKKSTYQDFLTIINSNLRSLLDAVSASIEQRSSHD
jgi:TatD DNase family protein